VLAHASDSAEGDVVNGLEELWQRHIVREQDAAVYDFSHDKIREVAYLEISATRRRLLHRRIAQALEILHPANIDRVSSQLAAHYEKAGLAAQAIPYYQRAGQAALRVYANHEAADHFQRGLALLTQMLDSVDRSRQELALLIELGPALVATKGYGFSQVYEVYIRAKLLTQQLGEPPNPAILRALGIFYIARRNHAQAYGQGEQILALAYQNKASIDPVLYVEAHYVMGAAAFWQGRFLEAREHLAQAVTAYDVQQHKAHITFYSQDPGVVCQSRLALTLWHLGYADQARRHAVAALASARQLAHPFSIAYALTFATWTYHDCRDHALMEALSTEAVIYCRENGLPFFLPIGLILQGWLLTKQGAIEAGIAQIRFGMNVYQTTEQDIYRPYSLAVLAHAYMLAGANDQALAALDEGLATTANYGDCCYAAELHRLKGELLHTLGVAPSVVEASFQQAYALACQQQAKSLELRAAMSLSRLWQRQGKHAQARQLLAESYSWFTEGFDTADLQEAKALLIELS